MCLVSICVLFTVCIGHHTKVWNDLVTGHSPHAVAPVLQLEHTLDEQTRSALQVPAEDPMKQVTGPVTGSNGE